MHAAEVREAGPLKAALFSPSMTWGGAEKMFKRLASGFAACGLSVDLVLATADGPNLSDLPAAVRVVDLRCRRLLDSSGALARYLDQAHPDVLLATQAHANLLAVWGRQRATAKPQLILREANTLSVASAGSRDVRDRVSPALARMFYPRADAVVAVSKGVAADLVERVGVPARLVRVIYNPTFGADIIDQMREPANHPWFVDGGPPVVLAVGRMSTQKRFATLVRAVARAGRDRPVRLLILGDGEERGRLEALARDLGVAADVSLPGFVANPYAYMARADLYVLSSAWEGFPNTLIEALACGLRVVATDCPSGPREILDVRELGPGAYGTLVPVDDHEAMAAAILAELGRERGAACLRRRAERFAAPRAVRSYMDLMCVGGRGRRS